MKEAGELFPYVSIGTEVSEFNFHRIFAPQKIIIEAKRLGFAMLVFSFIQDDRDLHAVVTLEEAEACHFGFGSFEFIKKR